MISGIPMGVDAPEACRSYPTDAPTEGGLPTTCTARDTLSFDGRTAFVNGLPVREAAREKGVSK